MWVVLSHLPLFLSVSFAEGVVQDKDVLDVALLRTEEIEVPIPRATQKLYARTVTAKGEVLGGLVRREPPHVSGYDRIPVRANGAEVEKEEAEEYTSEEGSFANLDNQSIVPLAVQTHGQYLPSEPDVFKVADGIGLTSPNTAETNRELTRRIELQDSFALFLVLVVFGVTVASTCVIVYQGADDRSPIAFYSDPTSHLPRLTCPSCEEDAFLSAFNGQPQEVGLRVVGMRRDEAASHVSAWLHTFQRAIPIRNMASSVLFDIRLDLAPFISVSDLEEQEAAKLNRYLESSNPLEVLVLQKHVFWADWEDVATNIRQRLRSVGFAGDIDVRLEAREEMIIRRNDTWCNFVRNPVTKMLALLSVLGFTVWVPYVWWRSKKTKLQSKFKINVDPAGYWVLLADGLDSVTGFHSGTEHVGAR